MLSAGNSAYADEQAGFLNGGKADLNLRNFYLNR